MLTVLRPLCVPPPYSHIFPHIVIGMKDKAALLSSIAEGGVKLIVGTHSLLFVPSFAALGLVVIDEQHKCVWGIWVVFVGEGADLRRGTHWRIGRGTHWRIGKSACSHLLYFSRTVVINPT